MKRPTMGSCLPSTRGTPRAGATSRATGSGQHSPNVGAFSEIGTPNTGRRAETLKKNAGLLQNKYSGAAARNFFGLISRPCEY